MASSEQTPGIVSGRLSAEQIAENFADLHPPLTSHQALVDAERCYFCDDAPCTIACPTSIDIPMFIRQIANGNDLGAADTILSANIMGGMCARVCPTEQLCEEVCVRNAAEEDPVRIGLLQRHATDALMADGRQIFDRAETTGKKIAVIGAGPAGLSCAHALARHGHQITIFESGEKPGGLNEFGIAAYKTVEDFARREVDYILEIGGITIEYNRALGVDHTLEDLKQSYDAVFVGAGMGMTGKLGIPGEQLEGVMDAVDYIADLRQAADLATLPVGRHVVVIGGGMTAIDIAVQSRRLGAEHVTLVYRRGPENMNASAFERDLAQISGVRIRHWAKPIEITGEDGQAKGVIFEYTSDAARGEQFHLPADMVFRAIGQKFDAEATPDLTLEAGRIAVNAECSTSVAKVWAGGDCVAGGNDLTVSAVEDGKRAAASIHAYLLDNLEKAAE